MGGAQPLAATMNDGTFLAADVDRARIQKRLDTRYLDVCIDDVDRAIDQALAWKAQGVAKSIGVTCNVVDLLRAPDRAQGHAGRPDRPDERARSAGRLRAERHDATTPRCALRASDPKAYERESFRTMVDHVQAMLALQERGADTFDYGNNLRGHAQQAGFARRVRLPGLRAQVHPAAVLRGQGPVPLGRAVGRSGGHRGHGPASWPSCSRTTARCCAGSSMAGERVAFQGLPARICWLGYGDRAKAGARVQRARANAAACRRRS